MNQWTFLHLHQIKIIQMSQKQKMPNICHIYCRHLSSWTHEDNNNNAKATSEPPSRGALGDSCALDLSPVAPQKRLRSLGGAFALTSACREDVRVPPRVVGPARARLNNFVPGLMCPLGASSARECVFSFWWLYLESFSTQVGSSALVVSSLEMRAFGKQRCAGLASFTSTCVRNRGSPAMLKEISYLMRLMRPNAHPFHLTTHCIQVPRSWCLAWRLCVKSAIQICAVHKYSLFLSLYTFKITWGIEVRDNK